VLRSPSLAAFFVARCVAILVAQDPQGRPPMGWRSACEALAGSADSLPANARRCAEIFVRVNGYTIQPGTTDTTEIVPEWGLVLTVHGRRPPTDWSAIVASRRGLLRPEPVAASCTAYDCLVIFEYAEAPYRCRFRALVLSLDLRRVGFAHQDILLRPDQLPARCRGG
jgi:hypothetical protein